MRRKNIEHTRREGDEESSLSPPKQWLPASVRWTLRLIVLPFVWLDCASQWLARHIIRPPYRQVGKCLRRGNCCRTILIPEPKGLLARFFYVWNTQVNGFLLRRAHPIVMNEKRMVVMGCRHLKESGQCARYRTRPMICRQWPRIHYFGHPVILKGCGFQAELRSRKD